MPRATPGVGGGRVYLYGGMEFTVNQVAEVLGGRVVGDGEATVRAIGRIEDAHPGELAFLSNPAKYGRYVATTRATAILVPSDYAPGDGAEPRAVLVYVDDVQAAMAALMRMYAAALPRPEAGVDERAYVHPEARVDPSAHVGPFAYVGKGARVGARSIVEPHAFVGEACAVGADCLLQTGARLLHQCVLGDRVRLLANAVVGADGFGHTREPDGAWVRIPHLGNVVVGDDCEVGACATVDRAVTGSTTLARGVKLDNLVMVAHNVAIGEHTAAAAQVGIAGSARLGARIQLGGQVGMAGHIAIADDVEVAAQSGLKDGIAEPGSKVFGSPAKPFREWALEQANVRRIPRLQAEVKALREEIDRIAATL